MKRVFQFRLARVARVREIFEGVARAEFAEALNHQHALERRCGILRNEIAAGHASQAAVQSVGTGALDITALLARERSIEALTRELAVTHQNFLKARTAAETRRGAWQDKKQDCKALETLEDRDRERHQKALFEYENEESEDSAAQAFTRAQKAT